ncbi:protein CHUP1, chloroplastic [Tanacetum coccineum]
MILKNNGVASKTTKEKVKSLALKAKITREQTSDDSDNQGGSDEEEEAEEFNLIVRNFSKFFRKDNQFGRGNRFGNGGNRFRKGYGNGFGNKGDGSSRQKHECYNCGEEGHFIEKHAFKNEHSKLFSKINELELEVKKLTKSKEVVEPCQMCEILTQEVDSLKSNAFKLQDEALNFSKLKKSRVVLDDMLNRQKFHSKSFPQHECRVAKLADLEPD